MKQFTSIKAFELTETNKHELEQLCLKVFPSHSFYMEEEGFIRMTKGTWADPESFYVHWIELIVFIIPTMKVPAVGTRGRMISTTLVNGLTSDKFSLYLGQLNWYCQ